jgi:hypothetical protein
VDCCNRNYEGEIKKMGDSVRINAIGDPTIFSVTKNSDITAPEALQDAAEVLTISQHKGFNFQVDDVDKAQIKPQVMAEATKRAGYGLAKTADIYVAGVIQGAVAAANQLPAATLGTGLGDGDAYELLVDLNIKLDENDVPEGMRWCVIPPWVRGLLQKDPRFTGFGTAGNRAAAEKGTAPNIDGMQVRVSNNVNGTTAGTVAVVGAGYTILAGSTDAVTFADQIPVSDGVEAFRPERRFADALKGHQLYGSLVQRPNSLASVVVNKA